MIERGDASLIVPLADITIDQRYQPRFNGLDECHVTALMESPEEWAAIVLVRQGPRLILIDGFHRVESARRLNLPNISSTIFEVPHDQDLFKMAFECNRQHGKALTLNDRKSYALQLIRHKPDLSNREIGRQVGINHETVAALRRPSLSFDLSTKDRHAGDLPDDVSLFDPIRFSKATRAQKAAAGYIQRLATALADPYAESSASWWCDDAAELARAVSSAMKADRASELFTQLESDAQFILEICSARHSL